MVAGLDKHDSDNKNKQTKSINIICRMEQVQTASTEEEIVARTSGTLEQIVARRRLHEVP